MLRLLFFGLVGYLVYRGLKSVIAPPKENPEVKGRPRDKQTVHIDRSNIEDARYKDIDE